MFLTLTLTLTLILTLTLTLTLILNLTFLFYGGFEVTSVFDLRIPNWLISFGFSQLGYPGLRRLLLALLVPFSGLRLQPVEHALM